MMGRKIFHPKNEKVNIESLIPEKHLLRRIHQRVDFGFVREICEPLYREEVGRPSLDPEVFFRILLVMYLYNIHSDRQVCEELRYNLAYRWFCRLSLEDKTPEHSSLTRIRDRLGVDKFKEVFDHMIRKCIEHGLIKGKQVMMDSSLIKANASLNSLVPKSKEGGPKKGAKPLKSIKGKKFSNKTHVSRTDPDCTLAGKVGEQKLLRYKINDMIDRPSRLIVDTHIVTGAEVDGNLCLPRLDAFQEMTERQWKLEGIFADGKDYHGLGRARYRGRPKMQIQAYMISFVQNLKRILSFRPQLMPILS